MNTNKLFIILKKALDFQKNIIPGKLMLKTIYVISITILFGVYQNGPLIIGSLIYVIWVSVRNKLPELDKLEHYYMGLIYFLLIGLPLVKLLGWGPHWYVIPSLILAGVKEMIDDLGYGNAEEMDFIKTVQFSVVYYLLFV